MKNTQLIIDTLHSLGFHVNFEKTVTTPTQIIDFFGLIIDSKKFKVFLPRDKIDKIKNAAESLLQENCISIREVAAFIGLIVHAFNAISIGPLYYRSLERDKVRALNENDDNYDGNINLSDQSKEEIVWWIENIDIKNGKPICLLPIDFWIESDASCNGMGAVFKTGHFSRNWSEHEKKFHINYLELLAIFFALQYFMDEETNVHVGIKCDNKTAISYVNNMGGMVSKDMDCLAKDIWKWCCTRNIWMTCQYLPGKLNEVADYYSRETSTSCEWSLKSEIFHRITKQFFCPDVDLFASDENYKIQKYVSWCFSPNAWKIDAFTFHWTGLMPYIFPPFHLLGRIFNKIREDRVEKAIVVFPVWRSQTWFPLLLSMIVSIPVRLPRHADLMTEGKRNHPLNKKITLAAAVFSGKPCRIKDFQKTLSLSYCLHGEDQHKNNMTLHGGNLFFGVINKTKVCMKHLKKI